MKNQIDSKHGAMISKCKNHHIKEVEYVGMDVRRVRNVKGLHLLPSSNILEVINLTRVMIQRKYISWKT
jgi:hypothetical protein